MTSEALGPTPATTVRQRESELHALQERGVPVEVSAASRERL